MSYKTLTRKHPGKWKTPVWGIVVGPLIALFCTGLFLIVTVEWLGIGVSDKAAAVSAKADTKGSSVKDYRLVSANDLFKEYEANEVAADNKYKGKLVNVQGQVQSITKDAFNNVIVQLTTPNQFMSVYGKIQPAEENKAAALTKGQDAHLYCKGGGKIVGSLMLNDCTIDSPK